MIKRTHKIGNIISILSDIQKLPFAKCVFDIILCTDVIEHVDHPKWLLGELHRVLKTGGVLILSVPNYLAFYPAYGIIRLLPSSLRRFFFKIHSPLGSFVPEEDPGVNPVDHAYSSVQVLEWLIGCEFSIALIRGNEYFMNFLPGRIFISRILSRALRPNPIFAYFFYVCIQEKIEKCVWG